MLGPQAQGLEIVEKGSRTCIPRPSFQGWSHEHRKLGTASTVPCRNQVCTQGPLSLHPGSMAALGEDGQSGQDLKGLDKRPYTTHSPSLRLVPGSGDRGLLLPNLRVHWLYHRCQCITSLPLPPNYCPKHLSPLQHPSSLFQQGPCFLVFLRPLGHLLWSATVPDTKTNQDHLLVGPHTATQTSFLKVNRK